MAIVSKVEIVTRQDSDSWPVLYLLYYPLLSKDACIVYSLIHCFGNKTIEQSTLMQLCDLSNHQFIAARKQLEQFHLLRTYWNKEDSSFLYRLFAPLHADEFLSHDTFSRLLLNRVGSNKFDQLKRYFARSSSLDATYEDVSEKTDVSPLDNWSSEKEQAFVALRPVNEEVVTYHFDFSRFFQGMDRIIPFRLRTKENLSRIAQLADLHGISEDMMRKYVIRSINFSKDAINFDTLKEYIYKNRTHVRHLSDQYQLAPVQFMAACQNGTPVAYGDRIIIENLSKQYKFSNEVINVLIEYVLSQTGQKFPKSYVEKVAGTWARLHIDTKEKALKQIEQPKKRSNENSSWYDQVDETKADESLIEEVQAKQNQLKGE